MLLLCITCMVHQNVKSTGSRNETCVACPFSKAGKSNYLAAWWEIRAPLLTGLRLTLCNTGKKHQEIVLARKD